MSRPQRTEVTQAAAYLLGDKKVRNNEAFYDAIIGDDHGTPLFKPGIIFDLGHGALKSIFIVTDEEGRLLNAEVIEWKTKGKTEAVGKAYDTYLENFKKAVDPQPSEADASGGARRDNQSGNDPENIASDAFIAAIAGAYDAAKKIFRNSPLPAVQFSMGGLQQRNTELSKQFIREAVSSIQAKLAEDSEREAIAAEDDHAGIQRAYLHLRLNSENDLTALQNRVRDDINDQLPTTIASGAVLSARLKEYQKRGCRVLEVDENPDEPRFQIKVPLNVIRKDILLGGSETQIALVEAIATRFKHFSYNNVAIIGAQPGSSNPGYFLVNKAGDVLLLSCNKPQADALVTDNESNPAGLREGLFATFVKNAKEIEAKHKDALLYYNVAERIGRQDVRPSIIRVDGMDPGTAKHMVLDPGGPLSHRLSNPAEDHVSDNTLRGMSPIAPLTLDSPLNSAKSSPVSTPRSESDDPLKKPLLGDDSPKAESPKGVEKPQNVVESQPIPKQLADKCLATMVVGGAGVASMIAGGIAVALTPAVFEAASPLTAMFTDPTIATLFALAIACAIVAAAVGISVKSNLDKSGTNFFDAAFHSRKEATEGETLKREL